MHTNTHIALFSDGVASMATLEDHSGPSGNEVKIYSGERLLGEMEYTSIPDTDLIIIEFIENSSRFSEGPTVKGIGTALCDYAASKASHVKLTASWNAHMFYIKLGYTPTENAEERIKLVQSKCLDWESVYASGHSMTSNGLPFMDMTLSPAGRASAMQRLEMQAKVVDEYIFKEQLSA